MMVQCTARHIYLAVYCWCFMAESKKEFYSQVFRYVAQVKRIIDGDTLELDVDMGMTIFQHKKQLRLAGVNAPESRTTDLKEKQRGLAAKSYLQFLCPIDSYVMIVTDRDNAEKYGRLFGTVYTSDKIYLTESVNAKMIAAGHCKSWDGQGKPPV